MQVVHQTSRIILMDSIECVESVATMTSMAKDPYLYITPSKLIAHSKAQSKDVCAVSRIHVDYMTHIISCCQL